MLAILDYERDELKKNIYAILSEEGDRIYESLSADSEYPGVGAEELLDELVEEYSKFMADFVMEELRKERDGE